MTPELIAVILAAVFSGGAITSVVSSISQRRRVGADATAVVTAAARELVDPLRRELATERSEHAEELEMERQKVREVRAELAAAHDEARELRNELAMARVEADALRREREADRAKIREQQRLIAQLKPEPPTGV